MLLIYIYDIMTFLVLIYDIVHGHFSGTGVALVTLKVFAILKKVMISESNIVFIRFRISGFQEEIKIDLLE